MSHADLLGSSLSIGSPVIGGDDYSVLFVDADGKLGQSADLIWIESSKSFIVGNDSSSAVFGVAGEFIHLDSSGNYNIYAGDIGTRINLDQVSSLPFVVYGTAGALLQCYAFGNVVTIGSANLPGATLSVESTAIGLPSMRVKQISGQTASLFQLLDSSANVIVDMGVSTVGFFGVSPAGQQSGGAATAGGTYGATEQSMLQAAYNCLRTFGFLS